MARARSTFSRLILAGAVCCVAAGMLPPVAFAADTEKPRQRLELSLSDALRIASERNFRLARSDRMMQMTEARRRSAEAYLLPRLDSYAYMSQAYKESGHLPYRPYGVGVATIGITQIIDVGGQMGRQTEQAALSEKVAQFDYTHTRTDIDFEIRAAYVAALRSRAIAEIEENLAAGLQELIAATGKRKEASHSFLEVELANSRQVISNARTYYELALDALRYALRLPSETEIELTSGFAYVPRPKSNLNSLVGTALANRSDVRQAELRIRQAELSVKQTKDMRKPYVSLSAFTNAYGNGRDVAQAFGSSMYRDTGVSLNINIPLVYFDWGMLKQNERAAMLQVEQAKADREEQAERITGEMRQSLIALNRAEQRIKSLPSRSAAEQALAKAEEEFVKANAANLSAALAQLSNARNNLRNAEISAVEAFADYVSASYRLDRSLGLRADAGSPERSSYQ